MKMVALIPARAGSKRCAGKNTRLLDGHPLIAYTIAAALESDVFSGIYVCSDDRTAIAIAMQHGVDHILREPVEDTEPDICWVRNALTGLQRCGRDVNAFAILRPTSPFRTADTIKRAFKQFTHDESHSLRAMQPVTEHPGKMWQIACQGYPAVPLIGQAWPSAMPFGTPFKTREDAPWHSQPTQTLPQVYLQNASLEMAWSYVIPAFGTISGRKVSPFLTEGFEGFDINTEDDFLAAEQHVRACRAFLPRIHAYR